MSNLIQVKESLADMTVEAVYDFFSLKASSVRDIVESFEVLKEKLGLARKQGLEVYRGLKMTLGAQGTKAWKARDVLNMLDKRANQKEYMQQVRRRVWLWQWQGISYGSGGWGGGWFLGREGMLFLLCNMGICW